MCLVLVLPAGRLVLQLFRMFQREWIQVQRFHMREREVLIWLYDGKSSVRLGEQMVPIAVLLCAVHLLVTNLAATLQVASPESVGQSECQVSLPNGVNPEFVAPSEGWFGEHGMYTGVTDDGTYQVLREHSSRGGGWNKRVWVRDPPGGNLTVDMKYLGDAELSSSPIVDIPQGYGLEGVQATVTWFPVEGCWEITGSTETSSVTIRVWVIFIEDHLATPIQT